MYDSINAGTVAYYFRSYAIWITFFFFFFPSVLWIDLSKQPKKTKIDEVIQWRQLIKIDEVIQWRQLIKIDEVIQWRQLIKIDEVIQWRKLIKIDEVIQWRQLIKIDEVIQWRQLIKIDEVIQWRKLILFWDVGSLSICFLLYLFFLDEFSWQRKDCAYLFSFPSEKQDVTKVPSFILQFVLLLFY